VGPEREALIVLADVTRPWVLADVPEARLRDVAIGAHARVLLGVEETHWCEGLVAYISPALDPNTRSLRIRIEVADRHPDLRPGVFAQAELVCAGNFGLAVAVPESALQTVEGEMVVFVPVAGTSGAFVKRVVRVGPAVGDLVPLLSGLAEGESYVATGTFVLKAELTKDSAGHEH
jgi:cobalt-zinc-cadmium efflux system membrane fusion protein